MNATKLQALVSSYVGARRALGEAVEAIRNQLGNASREQAKTALMPCIAKHYGVDITISESPRNAGARVLTDEAARKALNRLLSDLYPTKGEKNEPQRRLRISEAEQKLSDKIIAQVIDLGLTREHFDALIARVKAGVSW